MGSPLTASLIVLNVAVFLVVFSMPAELMEQTFEAYAFSQGAAIQFWRWITSLFLHGSASHLFFNMVGLWVFGRTLEAQLKPARFLAVYFMAGILGTLAFMLTSASPVIGASGAVFGLMGATMLLDPVKRIHLYLFPLPLGMVAVGFVIVETLVAAFQPSQFSQVATVAHLAGILVGAVFAFFFDPKKAVKGLLVLGISLALIIILGPVFGLITGIGGLVLGVIDAIIGVVLYTAAGLLAFLWV